MGTGFAETEAVMILKERQEQHKLNSALMSAMWTTSTQENYITREPAL